MNVRQELSSSWHGWRMVGGGGTVPLSLAGSWVPI